MGKRKYCKDMSEVFPFEDDDKMKKSSKKELQKIDIRNNKNKIQNMLSSLTKGNGEPYFSADYIKEKILKNKK